MIRNWIAGLVVAGTALSAFAQDDANAVPTLEIAQWQVIRDLVPQVVYRSTTVPALGGAVGTFPDSIVDFQHQEGDFLIITLRAVDDDWFEDDFDLDSADEEVFLGARACSASTAFFTGCAFVADAGSPCFGALGGFLGFDTVLGFQESPVAPPMPRLIPFELDPRDLFGATDDEGFGPTQNLEVLVDVSFQIPEFIGVNQQRLRGIIDYDVLYGVLIGVSNEDEPSEPASVSTLCVQVQVIENPALSPPSAPPFADAGADRTVASGAQVVLDGSRTFESNNIGFDPNDDDIFIEDRLTFTWEWISGPERVDPAQDLATNPLASVVLTTPGDYVYRLTVDDNRTSVPSTDSVMITVVDELPTNVAPSAVISGPSRVPVGAIVTLDGSLSSDPNADELSFAWTQTNAVGGSLAETLDVDEFAEQFQPLRGVDEDTATWQALIEGTYYFRLIVSDGAFSVSTPVFTVAVVSQEEFEQSGSTTGSVVSDESTANADTDGAQADAPVTPAACGSLSLALLAAPLVVLGRRRR